MSTPLAKLPVCVAVFAAAFLCVLSADAAAQGALPSAERPPLASQSSTKTRPELGYWSEEKARFFLSTQSEISPLYVKPYFSVGYGIPNWIWAGVDVNAITTTGMQQVYGGVRAATPIFNLALAMRHTWSFERPFLTPAETFTKSKVDDAPGSLAKYWAFEGEAMGVLPLPHSAIVANFVAVGVVDKPAGKYVFDESYRVVVKNPLFFVLRIAAVARFLNEDAFKVGVLGEYIFNTGRDHGVIRVGPIALLQLTDHLSVQAGLTLAAWSPDDLGFILGSYGLAGFRYVWATEERNPKLPWRGHFIP
jgi:hypothetical protein